MRHVPSSFRSTASFLGFVLASMVGLGSRAELASANNPQNPILFVTQVPMPEEVNSRDVTQSYESCVSPFANHLPDTAHAGRGGSLYVRFPNAQLVDLLAVADWSAIAGGKPAANTVAVRSPAVSWAADRAVFSMVVGAPSGPLDASTFRWQLYEITLPTQAQLNANVKPVITLVANQPLYNNVSPTYALAGRIVFASDRPWNGQAHLLQREEYLGLPTTTGIYSLDPSDPASLRLLHHAPSGAFAPSVDSSGRLVFTSWDHLSRDSEAVTDFRAGNPAAPYLESFAQTMNGSGNFANESAASAFTPVTAMAANTWDIFPEPRNFDHVTLIDVYGGNVNGNAQNIFLPWMINLDGTGGEVLNHVGRQELGAAESRSFKNDPNLVDLVATVNPGYGGLAVHTFFANLLDTREDPLSPGTYYGTDAADLGTHGAGQIIRLNNAGTLPSGAPQNPDGITITYVTPGATGAKPSIIPTVKPSMNLPATPFSPLATPENLYRTPIALADGNLVASHAAGVTQTDYNVGTAVQPASLFTFRLRTLLASGATHVPDILLTSGITLNTSYYDGATLVTYAGPAWELDPAEVAPRVVPVAASASIDPIEAAVFAAVGVDVPTFQNYLRTNQAALTVSRDVTRRDIHDRQQPFNLHVAGSSTQAVGAAGTIYDIAYLQVFQADLRRGYTLGGGSPAPGRRVVATPMHDTAALNPATPVGAPAGGLAIASDGSVAGIVPAGKALTWQLTDATPAHAGVVLERFWVTFQAGEIRTCANCHGINTSDQTGTIANPVTRPVNPPAALATLLQGWKATHPSGTLAHQAASVNGFRSAGVASVVVTRTGGTTGPASVAYATADGTAVAGADYGTTTGTLSWADGDTSPKTILVPLYNDPSATTNETFSVTLTSPLYASLGAITVATVAVDTSVLPDGGIGAPDAGTMADAGGGTTDGGTADGGSGPSTHGGGGCGCALAPGATSSSRALAALAILALGAVARSRRRPAA